MFRKFRVLKGVPPRPEFEGILLSMKGPNGVYFCIENNLIISTRYTTFFPVQKIEKIQKGDQCGMISAEQIFKPLNKTLSGWPKNRREGQEHFRSFDKWKKRSTQSGKSGSTDTLSRLSRFVPRMIWRRNESSGGSAFSQCHQKFHQFP